MSSGIPNSWAIASRWRTPFVEPPVAATDAIAFSSAALRDDVRRPDVGADEVHDDLAAPAGGRVLGRILGRDPVEAGRREADELEDHASSCWR